MSDIPDWIDKGKALTAESTEGPWEARMESPTMGGEVWTLRTAGQPGIKMVVSEYQFGEGNAQFIADARTRLPQALNALQAVHDLHQPVKFFGHSATWLRCTQGCPAWPCPTVQAIQNELERKETQA